jgi:type I restriction enzyme S subunit
MSIYMPPLSSIAEIRMGVTLRGRDATRPVPSGSYRLVQIGDISPEGTLRGKDLIRIEPNDPVSEGHFLRPGDVLFPNRGTRTTALAYSLTEPRTIAGAQFFVLRADTERVQSEYLAWFLRSEEAARHFASRRKGSYVQTIQRGDLAELEVPLPPLPIQRKIVEAAKLASTERKFTQRLADLIWTQANEQLLRVSWNSSRAESDKNLKNESH